MKSITDIYSKKQLDILLNANKRWNGSIGATRSGKTYYDTDTKIIDRISNIITNNYEGNIAIAGRSYDTIERNVVNPLRKRNPLFVSPIYKGSKESVGWHIKIFDKIVYLFPASKANDVDKIQGDSFAYIYCDELARFHKTFFDMVKSRLDKPYSICDFTCNPENSNHWLKQFIDDPTLDIHVTNFTIDDNPFLDKFFVDNLKKEYEGTVYYDRYILGKWVNAEGLVFPTFADSLIKDNANYGIYFIQQPKQYRLIHLGLDLGETKSKTILTASGLYYDNGYKVDTLEAIDLNTIDLDVIAKNILDFCDMIQSKYGVRPIQVWSDNNLGMVRNIGNNLAKLGSSLYIDKVDKNTFSLQDYIKIITTLLNNNKLKIGAKLTQNSLSTLLYDDKKNDDSILDNGTCDVDSYDSFRYSIVAFIKDYNLT